MHSKSKKDVKGIDKKIMYGIIKLVKHNIVVNG